MFKSTADSPFVIARHGSLLAFIFVMGALVLVSSAFAGADRSSCPNGFEPAGVPTTESQLREYPRLAAGLDAVPAPYSAQELIDLGGVIDGNKDGIFCLKAVSNLKGASTKQWSYFYEARDNDTASK